LEAEGHLLVHRGSGRVATPYLINRLYSAFRLPARRTGSSAKSHDKDHGVMTTSFPDRWR
ncbi:MAG TPA: hypothetical protein VF951_03240, partial [Streptosporangiaceae bacterium]